MDTSRARRQARSAVQRMASLADALLGRGPIFAASLYEQRSRCGKPQCKCAVGAYRHRQWCVSFVEDGRSRTRVVPAAVRAEAQGMTEDYRRVRRARRDLRRIFDAMLGAVDAVARARREAGRKRFDRLVARARAGGPWARPREGGPRS